jgi:hypothetical protein
MCPLCVTAVVLAGVGATSAGGLAALVVSVFRVNESEKKSQQKQTLKNTKEESWAK